MSRHQQTQALCVAAAHRAQSDVWVIEAAAKRRLADEYNGAQGRGVIIGAQDGARKRRERQRFPRPPPSSSACAATRAKTSA